MAALPLADIIIFSDDSKSADGQIGAGFVVRYGKILVGQGRVPLGQTARAYDAEIVGALMGLQAVFESRAAFDARLAIMRHDD